jgi:hypothetical protein
MKHEIQVLGAAEGGGLALRDRCTLDAADTRDAARKYAALFVTGPVREEPPTGADAAGVTVEQLTEALTEFRVTIRLGSAPPLLETGPVADPQAVAEVLHATLSRITALRPGDPAAEFVRHVAGMATDAERQADHSECDIEAARKDDTGSLDHLIGMARGIAGQP